METAVKNMTAAGKKPAKKISVSYHPELWGMGTQGRKQIGAGMAQSPQGRFPDGWRAKQPKQATKPTNGYKSGNRSTDQHNEVHHGRKEGRAHTQGAYKHYGGPQAFLSHDACMARHVTGEECEYGSTCCGKCRHHLRIWGARVWTCDNAISEKHGFPTDYGNTCAFFEREDLDRR